MFLFQIQSNTNTLKYINTWFVKRQFVFWRHNIKNICFYQLSHQLNSLKRMEKPAVDNELQPPAKKVCTDATPAVDLPATPEYHQKRLYEVSWNKPAVYPCLIVDIKDLPAEALATYKSSTLADKVPVKNFCDEEKT